MEPLERRDLLTGYVSVSATTSSVSEGSPASFGIYCMNPPPAGVTVHYQTMPGSATAGLDYTHLSGSVFLSSSTPSATINVSTTADTVNDPGESFSFTLTSVVGDAFLGSSSAGVTINQPSGPPQGPAPGSLTLDPVGTLSEGQSFYLTGRITPPATYNVSATINWGGFATMAGSGASFTTNSDGSFAIANKYYDDGVSPGNGTASDLANISMTATVTGVQLNANSTATIHNVNPTGTFNLHSYMPIGGPRFELTGSVHDVGIADALIVTIDWGDGSPPSVRTNVVGQFSEIHHYPPDGLTYLVQVTVTDDDLGTYSWSDNAPMYLLDLDSDADDNGEINAADDPIEYDLPGAYVGVNGDDDNGNGIVDMAPNEVTPVVGENDLEKFNLRWAPAIRPEANNYLGWHLFLQMTPPPDLDTGALAAKIYLADDKSQPLVLTQMSAGYGYTWVVGSTPPPTTLYLEALRPGVIGLDLKLFNPAWTPVDNDPVVFTALAFDPTVNLTIHDAQTDKPIPDADEWKTGAVTVANLNDTDADGIPDYEDHLGIGGNDFGDGVEEWRTGEDAHGRNEVDLMRLIVHKPTNYVDGEVKLTVIPAGQVRLWGDSMKKTNIDAAYDPATGIATWAAWGGDGDRTIWVEITTPSQTVADVTLKLEHKTATPEIVLATGVWAEQTAEIFSDTDWADLAGTIWRTQMDERLQGYVQQSGGTGKRDPILDAAGNQVIANRMAMRFTVTPENVSTVLSRVKFDITRRKESKGWWRTTAEAEVEVKASDVVPWPTLWEVGNDDSANNDESDDVLAGGHMFVTDNPRVVDLESPPVHFVQRWRYNNMQEFVRVRFDHQRPDGYTPNPEEPDHENWYHIDGSQCSDKEPWLSRISVGYFGMALKWQRMGLAGNIIQSGNIDIGNNP